MLWYLPILIFISSISWADPRREAESILAKFSHITPKIARLDKISHSFLGLPYGKNGPLGEGANGRYDQDPLYRFDTFDCTTYVETITALALANNVDEFEFHQDHIRYEKGEINYLKRNHFTDLQWIPNNIENGYFSEITYNMVPQDYVFLASALINFPNWLKFHKIEQIVIPNAPHDQRQELLDELKLQAYQFQVKTARVPYIPINDVIKNNSLLDNIPSGSIINFVRPNWDLTQQYGTHQNISHQGFVFKRDKTLVLRHASVSGMVEEVKLIDYLKKFQNHPTLKGIHFLKIN